MLPTGELNRVPSIPVTSNFGWSNWLHDQMPTSHNWRGNMALIIISFLSGYASGREGRISRRMPATIVGPVVPQSLPASPTLLSVDVINDPLPAAENDTLCTFSSAHASATSCHVEFRHGKMTLENPSSELLTVLIRELTGRTQ